MNFEKLWGIVLFLLGCRAWVLDKIDAVGDFFKRLFKKDVQK